MFFTRLARVVAILALVLGAFFVFTGVIGLTTDFVEADAETRRVIARHADQVTVGGAIIVLIAIALGVLAEIRLAIRSA